MENDEITETWEKETKDIKVITDKIFTKWENW